MNREFEETENGPQIRYVFECTWKRGEHHCDGEHIFLLNNEFCDYLINRLIWGKNMTVNKEILLKIIAEFHDYVDSRFIDNETNKLEHFMSIDMGAELLLGFFEIKFGNNA